MAGADGGTSSSIGVKEMPACHIEDSVVQDVSEMMYHKLNADQQGLVVQRRQSSMIV